MFSISEEGDIQIHEDGTIIDKVIGDQIETEFRTSRSRIISHFVHRHFFSSHFIKSLRNNFSNNHIEQIIDKELNKLFSDNFALRSKIKYFFTNEETKFTIIFIYKESEEVNRNLFAKTIKF